MRVRSANIESAAGRTPDGVESEAAGPRDWLLTSTDCNALLVRIPRLLAFSSDANRSPVGSSRRMARYRPFPMGHGQGPGDPPRAAAQAKRLLGQGDRFETALDTAFGDRLDYPGVTWPWNRTEHNPGGRRGFFPTGAGACGGPGWARYWRPR